MESYNWKAKPISPCLGGTRSAPKNYFVWGCFPKIEWAPAYVEFHPPRREDPEITSSKSGGADPLRREGLEIILTEIGGCRPPRREGPRTASSLHLARSWPPSMRSTVMGGPRNHPHRDRGGRPPRREGPRTASSLACTILATEGEHMGTSAERMRALRERERRGLRRFTIGVSEDDLRVIAEHGYEGATSSSSVVLLATISPIGATIAEPPCSQKPSSFPALAVATTQIPFW